MRRAPVFAALKGRAMGEDEVRRYLAENSKAWEASDEKAPDKPPMRRRR